MAYMEWLFIGLGISLVILATGYTLKSCGIDDGVCKEEVLVLGWERPVVRCSFPKAKMTQVNEKTWRCECPQK